MGWVSPRCFLGGPQCTFTPPSTLMTYAVVSREPLYTRLGTTIDTSLINVNRKSSGNIYRELSINSKGQAEFPCGQDQQSSIIFLWKRTTPSIPSSKLLLSGTKEFFDEGNFPHNYPFNKVLNLNPLPPWKLTYPLKIDGWKMIQFFSFWNGSSFQGDFSGRPIWWRFSRHLAAANASPNAGRNLQQRLQTHSIDATQEDQLPILCWKRPKYGRFRKMMEMHIIAIFIINNNSWFAVSFGENDVQLLIVLSHINVVWKENYNQVGPFIPFRAFWNHQTVFFHVPSPTQRSKGESS